MTNNKTNNKTATKEDFAKLLEDDNIKSPQVGDIVKGMVLSASKAEVRLDIDGVIIGVVRGPELYDEMEEYANLKAGDEVEATMIEEENENGELELSFKYAGEEKAWQSLRDALKDKSTIKVKVMGANKGGLVVNLGQIGGFLPVSQLAPENYPRVSGGDRGKILEKLKTFVGREFDVKVVSLVESEREEKVIFSEKDVWSEEQQSIMSKYEAGTKVEGKITAITDFGVFITFGENLEGLIHISELAWQRIDNPADLYSTGDSIKAEIISLDGSKIFLSAKKLLKDPWTGAEKKYKKGKIVKGTVIKVNPFGLFVKLDKEIHGLAHISQLGLAPNQKIHEVFKTGEKKEFVIVSIEPKEHRLGLEVKKGKEADDKDDKGEQDKKAGEDSKKKDDNKKDSAKEKEKDAKKDGKKDKSPKA